MQVGSKSGYNEYKKPDLGAEAVALVDKPEELEIFLKKLNLSELETVTAYVKSRKEFIGNSRDDYCMSKMEAAIKKRKDGLL